MLSVGMDIHSDKTVCDFFDPTAEPKRQHRTVTVPTTQEGLESALRPLKGRCRVAFEVGTQAQWVAQIIRPLAAEVQVANPSLITWMYRAGRKNDALDARKLSTLLSLNQLPTVHLPSADISAWRALINHRRTLVRRRTMIKNQIRSIVRTFAHRCPYRSCWTRVGMVWLRSLTFDAVRHEMMGALLEDLAFTSKQVRGAEARLDTIAKTQPNVALLRTIPGIGPRTAEAVVAFADAIKRFGNRRQFASYFGMTPTEDSSGRIHRHGHISKRGPSVVRWVLIEAVHQTIRRSPAFRAYFDRLHRDRRDRYKKAIVATGRKALTIMFAMMRDQTTFSEARVSSQAA